MSEANRMSRSRVRRTVLSLFAVLWVVVLAVRLGHAEAPRSFAADGVTASALASPEATQALVKAKATMEAEHTKLEQVYEDLTYQKERYNDARTAVTKATDGLIDAHLRIILDGRRRQHYPTINQGLTGLATVAPEKVVDMLKYLSQVGLDPKRLVYITPDDTSGRLK